jgi:hypothetical protein
MYMRRVTSKPHSSPPLVIPKALTHGIELIVLTRETYEREVKRGKDIARALQVIAEGEHAHREGRTVRASSLEDALKRHAKRSH